MTGVALKFGTVLVFTCVLSLAIVLAFLALVVFARLPLSPHTASTFIGASPVDVDRIDDHDRLATE